MRTFFCLLLCFFSSLYANELHLKNKIAQALPGSFVVLEQDKTYTFFHIHSRSQQSVILEEVSIPAAVFNKVRLGWKDWFERGAPGHTCWLMLELNLATGTINETFSFTHQGWVDMSDSNSFLTTLLNLRFQEVSPAERRKIGLPPGQHRVDRRPIWNPRLVANGLAIQNVSFSAYKARWPADGSELARKIIEVYLPKNEEQEGASYPLYFPYWLEVDGKLGSAKIRVVDSGLEAQSPKGGIPQRPHRSA